MAEPQAQNLFVVNGKPVAFYLYGSNEPGVSSALSEDELDEYTEKIITRGGNVCHVRDHAETILANEGEGLDKLVAQYRLKSKHVEKPTFVDDCIQKGWYSHRKIKQKGMGGRPPGRSRNHFTKQEDGHLCEYLALRIPNHEAGGRTGNGVYQELMEEAQANPDFSWALRHTWESWRERYKKNKENFNRIIDQIVKENPPPASGKGLYPLSRLVNKRQHREFMQQAEFHFDDEEEPAPEKGQEQQEQEQEEGEFPDLQEEPHPAEKPQARQRRRTAVEVQRQREASQPRGRHSAPSRVPQAESREPSPAGEFQPMDDDFQFPEREAGPSGAQRSPSPTPPPPAKKAPAPRPVRSGAAKRPAPDQMPMSSQATLVNPTQPRRGASVREQEEDAPRKRRKTNAQPQRVANRTPPQRGEDEEPMDSVDEAREEVQSQSQSQSQPAGQTNEDAMVVENMLNGSFEDGERVSSEPSDRVVPDSEDERSRQKLHLSPLRSAGAQAGPSRAVPAASHKPPGVKMPAGTIQMFAASLNLGFDSGTGPGHASRSMAAGPSTRAPVTPSNSRSFMRAPSASESTSASSSERGREPFDIVPLQGSRASAEKKKARELAEREAYSALEGTRAQQFTQSETQPASEKVLRNRRVPK